MFSERLKELRKEKRVTQINLAKMLDIRQSSISKWESNISYPDFYNQQQLASFFGVSIDYLLGNAENRHESQENFVKSKKIPVYGYINAKAPFDEHQEIIGYEHIDEATAKTGEIFALQIREKNNEPRFLEGDVVICKKQNQVESGQFAVVCVENGRASIKKVQKNANGITLMALNSNFTPIFYSNEQIKNMPVTIYGKIIELRAKI